MKIDKVPYTVMSDKVCSFPGCTKHIKTNIINRIPNAKYCYKHFKEVQHSIPTTTHNKEYIRARSRPV